MIIKSYAKNLKDIYSYSYLYEFKRPRIQINFLFVKDISLDIYIFKLLYICMLFLPRPKNKSYFKGGVVNL